MEKKQHPIEEGKKMFFWYSSSKQGPVHDMLYRQRMPLTYEWQYLHVEDNSNLYNSSRNILVPLHK